MKSFSLIAAMSYPKRIIGNQNELPWRISDDLKRFRSLTENHIVIMGKFTAISLKKPLPNRVNLVLSREKDFQLDGFENFFNLENALRYCESFEEKKIFVIGGQKLYEEAILLCDQIYLTEIYGEFSGDRYFPLIPANFFLKKFEFLPKSVNRAYGMTFKEYQRLILRDQEAGL